MTRRLGAPLPPPRPMSAEEQAAYDAELRDYRERVETCKAALRALASTHGPTELLTAWQDYASEGEETLPGAVAHHTPEAEAAVRAAQGTPTAPPQEPQHEEDFL